MNMPKTMAMKASILRKGTASLAGAAGRLAEAVVDDMALAFSR
ncbi:hypothetical protein Sa4125_02950 [Aureimonas sp. SA4125]|nr:hypothetical protein Sa4125_02950 [Aureimonas sp. SA4125]